jgi:hypothetical protein
MNPEAMLAVADAEPDAALRRLWLVAAVEAVSGVPVCLVGGAAVDLHTGSYKPTDVDLVGPIGRSERARLVAFGFTETGGRRVRWGFSDGTSELIEFPERHLDGSAVRIDLSGGVVVRVISLESLMVDRINQATDGTDVTFDEAVHLAVAAAEIDWAQVRADLDERPESQYLGAHSMARRIALAAKLDHVAKRHFPA